MVDESLIFLALLAASRPKTLMAAVLPVSLATVLTYAIDESFNYILFGSIILSTLCIQIATNLFNDAIDNKKGADTDKRIGPKRINVKIIAKMAFNAPSIVKSKTTFLLCIPRAISVPISFFLLNIDKV